MLSDFPFEKVIYSHPSIKQKRFIHNKKGNRRLVTKDNEGDFELDELRHSAKQESHQPLAEVISVNIKFRSRLKFERQPKGESLISASGLLRTNSTGSDVKIKQPGKVVSTNEPILGGEIQPIEFSSLQIPKTESRGLESFILAINFLKSIYPHITFGSATTEIPGDKLFCEVNGIPRKCIVIEVSQPNLLPCYIIEIARPDKWSISTLFIRYSRNNSGVIDIEQKVSAILSNVVAGSGHWQMKRFAKDTSLDLILLKHSSDEGYESWARRIMGKLARYGFKTKVEA
ncbi:hypothetical protein BH24ACI2_BH24ACI2_08710 [soil metagenome]|jgi:hypothetical protein